eukprot:TRINITY_DN4268_c0_g1_i1.p1 TRINITY_DN4268_c0_g1~~TRINITY_DN4268_c0_g1_i1.p1  ORF type:complete len:1004 (+),score=207.99 TRINITY_DN4268_c0_g1_i1:8-3019(+)
MGETPSKSLSPRRALSPDSNKKRERKKGSTLIGCLVRTGSDIQSPLIIMDHEERSRRVQSILNYTAETSTREETNREDIKVTTKKQMKSFYSVPELRKSRVGNDGILKERLNVGSSNIITIDKIEKSTTTTTTTTTVKKKENGGSNISFREQTANNKMVYGNGKGDSRFLNQTKEKDLIRQQDFELNSDSSFSSSSSDDDKTEHEVEKSPAKPKQNIKFMQVYGSHTSPTETNKEASASASGSLSMKDNSSDTSEHSDSSQKHTSFRSSDSSTHLDDGKDMINNFVNVVSDLKTLGPNEVTQFGKKLSSYHSSVMEEIMKTTEEFIEQKKKKNLKPQVNWNWNERFQEAMNELRTSDAITSERLRIYSELSNLSQDFCTNAKTYGRIIITEVVLPNEHKTIKPCDLGGYAGGTKYIVNGIMFKFAFDSNGLYGNSDMIASKVAGHEMRGLMGYLNLGLQGLHFPMMALVDFMGFRLIAMSVLPISGKTLIYGTSDGGTTVHNENRHLDFLMHITAKRLNIKPHRVGNLESNKMLYSAADLEGHYSNNAFYLVDFSRVFPPAKPDPNVINGHLHQMIRPEFCRSYSKPLCPDAYSGFVSPDFPEEEASRQEIEEATDYLLLNTIPTFARELNAMSGLEARELNLVNALHRRGINLRYMGLLRQQVTSIEMRFNLFIEMVARVVKQTLRERIRETMRSLQQPLEQPCRRVIIQTLNLVFGTSEESDKYWSEAIRTNLQKAYSSGLSQEEEQSGRALKRNLLANHHCLLFRRLLVLSHLKFYHTSLVEFSNNSHSFQCNHPFDETDLEEIEVGIRYSNIMALAQGYVLKHKGIYRDDPPQGTITQQQQHNDENSKRLLRLAINRFEEALRCSPGDKRTLREIADAAHHLGDIETAVTYFRKAIEADPKDSNTFFKFAVFMEETERFLEAEDLYLKTLEINPTHDHCLQRYGYFLELQGITDLAEELYIRASECRKHKGSKIAMNDPDTNVHGRVKKKSVIRWDSFA